MNYFFLSAVFVVARSDYQSVQNVAGNGTFIATAPPWEKPTLI
jgi:hypothetical protein